MSGGIERQLTELLLRLDRSRFEPHVVVLYGTSQGYSQHFAPLLTCAGIPVVSLDLRLSALSKLVAIGQIIRQTWRLDPDIVHALNYHSNLLTRLSRPFLPPRLKLLGALRTAATAKQLRYERLSAGFCSAIVCNSPHLQSQLVGDAGIRSGKVHLIPNGVDTARFAHNPDPALRERLAKEVRFVFLCMGRISHQKAQHLLVEAIGRLHGAGRLPATMQCWFVGEVFNQAAQAQYDAAIQQHGIDHLIQRFPATYQPESYYHAADVVILPSFLEGMPNVALEALATGRPVLLSEAANGSGIIRHQHNGWVFRTGDAAHLAEILHEVMQTSPDRLQIMREAGRQSAQEYSMSRMVSRYHELYEQL